jgi:tetratricopeptide (TPR) repeat protein
MSLSCDPEMVGAHVRMGIFYEWTENYEKMLRAFKEAIRLDPQATRAAAGQEPEEVGLIRQILFPSKAVWGSDLSGSMIPTDIREASELVWEAMEHLTAGHDRKAIEVLEHSLRIDPTFPLAISLLSLAYLLFLERTVEPTTITDLSVLHEIAPAAAKLLFRRD